MLRQGLKKWTNRWNQMMEQKKFCAFFLFVTLFSFLFYIALSFISLGRIFPVIFYVRGTDSFMDFFNSIRDAYQGLGAYTERHIIYPPMANLFFWLMAKLTPEHYNQTEFDDRRDWLVDPNAIAVLLVFIAVCTLLFAFLVWKNVKTDKKTRLLFTAATVFCLPYFNMIERGNILIFCIISLLVFILTYDDPRWYVRELGLLALAFAFSIKLYPLLFAWILIADKRIGATIRCVIYSIAMLVLPSFCFGGPKVLIYLLENIFSFSSGGGGAANGITSFLRLPALLLPILTYSVFVLAALNFLVAPWIYQEKWKVFMCGCLAFVAFPPLTSTYGWILFILPLIMLVNSEMKREDFPYIVTMTVPFAFICVPISFHVTANAVAVYACLWILLGMTSRRTLQLLCKKTKKSCEGQ